VAQPHPRALASHVNGTLVALAVQPDEEPATVPPNPLSEGDLLVFLAFVIIIAFVFGFDMMRTWWQTNRWRRDARRRRRQMR
jgi:hypothetical protein